MSGLNLNLSPPDDLRALAGPGSARVTWAGGGAGETCVYALGAAVPFSGTTWEITRRLRTVSFLPFVWGASTSSPYRISPAVFRVGVRLTPPSSQVR